jgi:U3 small nucleolar RNA-associated protein 14
LAAKDADAKVGAEVATLMGMAGWGSWAGEGVKPSRRQQERLALAQKIAVEAKASALAKRKDAKMDTVLMNEKKDKKAAKFMCANVPYPFTSREQYEMAMRNPLGSDWNTTKASNALTVPEVMSRAGKIIEPLRLTNAQLKGNTDTKTITVAGKLKKVKALKKFAQRNARKAKL